MIYVFINTICISGAEVVSWLVSWNFASTREEATLLGQSLINEGFFSNQSKKETALQDSALALYKFTEPIQPGTKKRTGSSLSIFANFHGQNSDDDELEVSDDSNNSSNNNTAATPQPQPQPITVTVAAAVEAGNLDAVKSGFLVKKGHVRHNWKTRWFVLHKTKPMLEYFKNPKVRKAMHNIMASYFLLIIS